MSAPTLWQVARAMADLAHKMRPGIDISIGFMDVAEDEMRRLSEESGVATDVQPSGHIIGGVLESLHYCSDDERIHALCTRQARPGDEKRVRR